MNPDNRPVVLGSIRLKVGQVWIVKDGKYDRTAEIVATDRATGRVQLWDGCTRRQDATWHEAAYLAKARRTQQTRGRYE